MDRELPPEAFTPVPPRPDLDRPPRVDAPVRRRRSRPVVAFLLVLAITVAALGGGLVAIQRLTTPESDPSQHGFHRRGRPFIPTARNPCEPISYVINPNGSPEGSIDDVHEAVRRVSVATGIVFVYEGLTDEDPSRRRLPYQPGRYGERWAPVLIGWVDPEGTDIPFERDGHQAAAVASPARPLSGEEVFVSGFVAMSLDDPNPPGFAWPGAQGPVLLHELGHVMGLAHVEGPGEIMEPSGGGMTDFGPGDLEGLRRLGRESGCVTPPPLPT